MSSPPGRSGHLSYDTLASLLATYGSQSTLAVARQLDAKIERLLETAANTDSTGL